MKSKIINRYGRYLTHSAFILIPFALFVGIWLPVVVMYHAPGVNITSEVIERSRQSPTNDVLAELAGVSLMPRRSWDDTATLVAAAEEAMQGIARVPGLGSHEITLPLDPKNLTLGLPTWQLNLASFYMPRLLLDAYQATYREEFLLMARDIIVAWVDYEATAWLPRGLLWNEHAVAERIYALSQFWYLYRGHPSFDQEVGRKVLEAVASSAQRLEKPALFKVWSNHGLMQNLALWHIATAFPAIPGSDTFSATAHQRFADQAAFHLSEDGGILENSPEYHAMGLKHFALAFRYLTLLEKPIPASLRVRYEKGVALQAAMARPDGSLPVIGDTDGDPDRLGPLVAEFNDDGTVGKTLYRTWRPTQASQLYPVSGYAIWWSGLDEWPSERALSQTVVAWSSFPYLAHKHADELSLTLWANGVDWWTNVGYWTYGIPGRAEAVSWNGSNAPHLLNEAADSRRSTRLVSSLDSKELRHVHVRRDGPGDYSVSRQVMHVPPDLWLVVDTTEGTHGRESVTVWNASIRTQLTQGSAPNEFVLSAKDNSSRLTAYFLGPPGVSVRALRGSSDPFAGWQIDNHEPVPADAIVVTQSSSAPWSATVWHLASNEGVSPPERMKMVQWSSPTDWSLEMQSGSGTQVISRSGTDIRVAENGSTRATGRTLAAADQSANHKSIRDSFVAATAKYPMVRDYVSHRSRVTVLLGATLIVQGLFFLLIRRRNEKVRWAMRYLCLSSWIVGGAWLLVFYFP